MINARFGMRFVSILVVIGSLFGALLMMLIGFSETLAAYQLFFGLKASHVAGKY